MPRLVLDASEHDFGRFNETEQRRATLWFTNGGDGVLNVREVKASCGCTAVSLARHTYGPGERGQLEVVFTPAGPGDQKKYVWIHTDASETPAEILLRADVEAFIALSPTMLEVGRLAYRQEHRFSLEARCSDPAAVIETLAASNPRVSAGVRGEKDPSGAWIIDVTVSPEAAWGGLFSWIELVVRGRPTPQAATLRHTGRVRLQGQIFGELAADPDTIRFGVKPGEAFERRVSLRRDSGAPFRVFDLAVNAPELRDPVVRLEPDGAGGYDLVFIATGGSRLVPCQGEVTFHTDVPGEEALAIPISGKVRHTP
jgi:hypothetical protein